jgi:hypothetical protein
MNGNKRMTNLILNPIIDEIKNGLSVFNSTYFKWVYREFFNVEVDI